MSKLPPPQDPADQLALFSLAVDLLGGQRATARALDIGERTVRGLCSGERPLHDGFLRDAAAALIEHANRCRALERRISPAFAANLTEDQRARQSKPDARRYDVKGEG